MMDVYTTAFLIVLTTVVLALIGGYLVLYKLRLIRSRKPVVTDGALVELLKSFSLPKNEERVVCPETRPLIERYMAIGYFDFGLNDRFELTARTSKLGEKLLNVYQ